MSDVNLGAERENTNNRKSQEFESYCAAVCVCYEILLDVLEGSMDQAATSPIRTLISCQEIKTEIGLKYTDNDVEKLNENIEVEKADDKGDTEYEEKGIKKGLGRVSQAKEEIEKVGQEEDKEGVEVKVEEVVVGKDGERGEEGEGGFGERGRGERGKGVVVVVGGGARGGGEGGRGEGEIGGGGGRGGEGGGGEGERGRG